VPATYTNNDWGRVFSQVELGIATKTRNTKDP